MKLEKSISRFLWIGGLCSNAVIALGMVMSWLFGMGYPPGRYPTTPADILAGVLARRPGAILSLGVVLLLSIPVGRILLLFWGYGRRKEYELAGISATVLLLLTVALLLGVRH